MGFEGYMAYDISELINANPWKEAARLSSLPVYRNREACDENGPVKKPDFEKMRALLTDIAGRLGLDESRFSITDNAPDEKTRQQITEKMEMAGDSVPEGYFEPSALILQAEGIKIEVDGSLTAEISFSPALRLPAEYSFHHFSSRQELEQVAQYLSGQYASLIGMQKPQLNITGGDYNIYLQQGYQLEFFEGAGGALDRLLGYSFKRIAFYCDDEGALFLVRLFQTDLSEKVGDYPAITAQQAEKLLLEGHYLTSVPCEMPGAAYIKKVELLYPVRGQEKEFLPYYRFYVELPEEERENGLKTYGAYYVPAIESRYIANMPQRGGGFH